MIKIVKQPESLPISLIVAEDKTDKHACDENIKTHTRRVEIINNKAYKDVPLYNRRYKYKDIKSALKLLYNRRCAFCEQNARPMHVEHFRPKSYYYWLAYSWDNLLLACASCNSSKKDKFEIAGNRVVFDNVSYSSIHSLSANYDEIEKPLLLNPEKDDLKGIFIFDSQGNISSNNPRGIYTIKTCALYRPDLNSDRYLIVKHIKRDLNSIAIEYKTSQDRLREASKLLRKLITSVEEGDCEFNAFRTFIAKNLFNKLMMDVFN